MLWAPCEGAPTAHMKKWLGLALTVGVVVAALTAPWLAAIDPMVTDFASSLKPPGSPGHPLGTDQLGRDLLARVLYGARLALFIGACTVAVTAAGWVVYARVVRGEVLSVKQRDYVHAAAALGVGRPRLLFRHVLPNVAPSIVVVASLQFSQFVVAEAAISFLGFGVQPPTPAWGSMLSESRDFLYVAWWLAAFPGAALALTALGVNLLGDWLRDTLDPKLRV